LSEGPFPTSADGLLAGVGLPIAGDHENGCFDWLVFRRRKLASYKVHPSVKRDYCFIFECLTALIRLPPNLRTWRLD
ncbi:hypothetical protein Ancab_034224, partial [Ancistrocladus abbreviatus]